MVRLGEDQGVWDVNAEEIRHGQSFLLIDRPVAFLVAIDGVSPSAIEQPARSTHIAA